MPKEAGCHCKQCHCKRGDLYWNATFVLMSTGGWKLPEWSPCRVYTLKVRYKVCLDIEIIWKPTGPAILPRQRHHPQGHQASLRPSGEVNKSANRARGYRVFHDLGDLQVWLTYFWDARCFLVLQSCSIDSVWSAWAEYRVAHLLANLSWVDFDLGCSTILLGQ